MGWLDEVKAKIDGRRGAPAPAAPRPDLAEFFGSAETRASGAPEADPPTLTEAPAAEALTAAPSRSPVQDADTATDLPVAPFEFDEPPTRAVAAEEVTAPVDVRAALAADDGPRMKIEVRWDVRSAPAADEPVVHALVSLSPEGPSLVGSDQRTILHLVLALDLSASMRRPDKYPVLQDALRVLLADLHAAEGGDVRLSVIAFGRGSEFVLRDVSARTLTADRLLDAVHAASVRFTNYTDVGGALALAARVARRAHHGDRRVPIRVMVLTDGRPQDHASAHREMERLRCHPADVDCLCFGDDADVETMKKLVCGGRGGTVKMVGADSLADAFGRIAEVARRVIAKRSLVDVDLREGAVGGGAWRFRPGRHDFGASAFVGGRRFATDLGTVERERTYSLVLRIRMPSTTAAETEAGRVTVRVPGEGGARTFEAALVLPRHAGSAPGAPDPVVRQALEIVGAGVAADAQAQLRSLRARRALHQQERRDARSIAVIDRAIALLEGGGTLDDLSPSERAVLAAHTRTVHARGRRTAGVRA